jgi:hypothetical protein
MHWLAPQCRAAQPALQLTAFGARDRGFFEVTLCRASAAAEAQSVSYSASGAVHNLMMK